MLRFALLLMMVGGCGQITLSTDEDLSVNPDDDLAAFMGDMAGMDGPVGNVAPAIRVTPDYVGLPTKLDSTASTDKLMRSLSYSWHFTKVPNGSHVADNCAPTNGFATCLTSVTNAMPSFEPDLGGDYEIELTATAGSDTASLRLSFTVPTEPVFAAFGRTGLTSDEAISMVRSDGTGFKDVSCRKSIDGGVFSSGATEVTFGYIYAGAFGLRQTFSNANNKVSYMNVGFNRDGGIFSMSLFSGNEATNCNTSPGVRIDDPAAPDLLRLSQRFSPDGSRISYIQVSQQLTGASQVITVGADGSGLHHVSTAFNIQPQSPPIWLDNSNLGWVEVTGAPGPNWQFTIKRASDAEAPASSTFVDCSASGLTHIQQIEVVSVVAPITMLAVASKDPITDQSKPGTQTMDIYKLTGSNCTLTNLTSTPTNHWARDMVLTPDLKTIYYSSNIGGGDADGGGGGLLYDIWTVPVSGAAAPAFFAGLPDVNDVGPKVVANGKQIVWTQTFVGGKNLNPDGGFKGGGLMIANIDGTHMRSLLRESGNFDAGQSALAGANTGAIQCSVAGDDLGDALRALFGGAAAAVLLTMMFVLRRRRRLS